MESITFETGIIGKLRITEEDQMIVGVDFIHNENSDPEDNDISCSGKESFDSNLAANTQATPLLARAKRQILEYLEGEREEFTIPIRMKGTKFQQEVWTALLDIPYAETCSYGDVAKAIGKPKACRAVGMANNKNPLPIIIPCHRVIGADGRMVGYAAGLDIKAKLQSIERRSVLTQIFGRNEN